MTWEGLKEGYVGLSDYIKGPIYDPNEIKPPTRFSLELPDTIKTVIIKMGGRTVEFDADKFMDVLENFK